MPLEINNIEALPFNITQIGTIEIVSQMFVSDAFYDNHRINLSVYQWLGSVKQGKYSILLIKDKINSLMVIHEEESPYKKPLRLPFKDVLNKVRYFIAIDSKRLYIGEYEVVDTPCKLGLGIHIPNIPEGVYPLSIQVNNQNQIVGLQIRFHKDDSGLCL